MENGEGKNGALEPLEPWNPKKHRGEERENPACMEKATCTRAMLHACQYPPMALTRLTRPLPHGHAPKTLATPALALARIPSLSLGLSCLVA